MISLKSSREIELMAIAGSIVGKVHKKMAEIIRPGISTLEIDRIVEKIIRENDATPSFKNYQGFPCATCTSINDMLIHGIPDHTILKDGDIISIDVGACYKGYHGDSGWTYRVGNVSEDVEKLLQVTEQSLYEGLKQVKPGNHIGDIGAAISDYATKHKLGVVKELVGHGVGTSVHEEPDVPNYGIKGTGPMLKEGMVICIEPMLTFGSYEIYQLDDGWTINTEDGSAAAHYEHTVLVTKDGYEILTPRLDD